uniref:Beta-microseminoprotein-like n=1 Tax=Ascaris lumbricoides TaxID=6252 RepID=A0A0M3I446_ASCLU
MPVSTFFVVFGFLSSFCIIPINSEERTQCGGIKSKVTGRWVETYICPNRKYTTSENRCCDPPEYGCCREASFFEKHTTAIISSSLIMIFVVFIMVMVICLCWEKCILHKAIRKRPSLDYIPQPEEVEHLNGIGVPCEQSANTRVYEVNADITYRQNKDLV